MSQQKAEHTLGVILDEASFNPGDLNDQALLSQLDDWQRYAETQPGEVQERIAQADVVVLNKVKLTAELIAASPRLRCVLLTATGSDNVDLKACTEHGVTVCNVTDYCTPSLSQHVFALILALATSLPAYSAESRDGSWSESAHFSLLSHRIVELSGKQLGLVGYGTLAKGVEKLARAFDMQVLIAARPGQAATEGRLLFDEVIERSDVLSLHCPLTPETHHLINAQRLEQMKPSAFLINTARGAVVDTHALANALKQNQIAGAGIDVLEQEPPEPSHPILGSDVPNLILTPHTAWASLEARQRLLDKVAENLAAWSAGQPIRNLTA